MNWFLTFISKDAHTWLGCLPLAHTFTIYTTKHLKSDPKLEGLNWEALLEKAWEVQFTGTPSMLMDVDVECEWRS